MENQSKAYIPLIILFLLLIGGVYYWQSTQNDPVDFEKNTSSEKAFSNEPIVLGGPDEGIVSDGNISTEGNIEDGTTYKYQLSQIRKPVNDAMYELVDRNRYSNKFTKEDVLEAAATAKEECNIAIEKLEDLEIRDATLSAINEKQITSVDYLKKAIEALEKFYDTEESKYADEFGLNIDYSNREINNISY